MKYIKLFENNNEPDIGDYVLLNDDYDDSLFDEFVTTNIGTIIGFEDGWNSDKIVYKKSEILDKIKIYYLVQYEDVPDKILDISFMWFGKTIGEDYSSDILTISRSQIREYSSDRKDLEMKLVATKYNL